jgi:hypothetical protein
MAVFTAPVVGVKLVMVVLVATGVGVGAPLWNFLLHTRAK